jgi:hypothetical protein
MKNFFKFLFLVAFVVTLQSCSKDDKKPTTTQQSNTQQQTTNSGSNTTSSSSTDNAVQNFSMVNNTGMTLIDVFISPNDANTWGEDVIPKDVIANGETFDFTFTDVSSDKCIWDIKFTGENGTEYIMQDVNLCKTATITLTPQ